MTTVENKKVKKTHEFSQFSSGITRSGKGIKGNKNAITLFS
ncbi:hypothetical protein ACN4FE_05445 [Aliarcobacter butzleri]